jgi:hypothetical protein
MEQLFQTQGHIGWNHIIYGRFANEWTNPLFGSTKKWLQYTIRILFQQIYEVWKARCDVNHGNSERDTRKRDLLRLTPKITKMYNLQDQIDQTDRNIFSKTSDQLLELPTNCIENWLFKAKLRIQNSIKLRKLKERNITQQIHPFFQQNNIVPKPTTTNQHVVPQKRFQATFLTQFFLAKQNENRNAKIPKNDLKPP